MGYTGSGSGVAIVEGTLGGASLTNQSTIQGTGLIGNSGLNVANGASGVINANVSGQTLTLNQGGSMLNHGLLEATNGGTLNLSSLTVDNSGGNVTAGAGSTVLLTNTFVNGGTLNNNGGTLETSSFAELNGALAGGITLNGTYTGGTGGARPEINGTITNNLGTLVITGGSGTNAFLALAGNTTLQGGTVTLAYTGSGNGVGVIEQSFGGTTLTNNALIQGGGIIGNGGIALNNTALGTINANVSGQTLFLNGSGGTTNHGLLEATNGGTLELDSQVIANANANITAGS